MLNVCIKGYIAARGGVLIEVVLLYCNVLIRVTQSHCLVLSKLLHPVA